MATPRGDRARTQIMAEARGLLVEHGVDGFSLREVARRTGYAPSALYNHFRDKDALVTALAIEAVTALATSLGEVADGPAPARLRALGLAYARFALDHAEEYRVIFDCLANPPHTWEEYVGVAHPFSMIVETCGQGLAEGTLVDPVDVGAAGLAYALWSLVDGHVHLRQKHLARIDGPFDRLFAAALDSLIAGMTASREETR